MIGITVTFHAAGLEFIIHYGNRTQRFIKKITGTLWRPALSAVTVIGVFVLHVVQIWLWAGLYMLLDCHPLNDFTTALQFSTEIYTTIGDANISLEKSCRILSGVEGANGFLLFGCTAAFVFELTSQFYRRESSPFNLEL
jgi:hypothetical protein